MDLACLCEALTGLKNQNICMFNGKAVAKLKRKEYRLMSDDERTRFNQAMLNIKQNGKFWLLVDTHSNMQTTLGAHAGPAFLPWHREFIKRLEFELRRVDPEVFLPYWDSTLESRLPAPKDSSLFSPELMGTGTWALIDGPFANWMDLNNRFLQRQVGFDGSPFTDEGLHAEIHLWIGGHMLDPMTSANDPIFYLHHAFVDLIWETWRQSKQKRNQMENEYPSFRGNCTGYANGEDACYNGICKQDVCQVRACARKPEFMNCNCRVSCGLCTPSNYLYGGCNDYHQECRMWAQRGECKRSTWMEENCRASCGTCFDMLGLASRCPSTSGATLIANVKPLETLIDNGKIYQEMEPVIVGENMFDGHIIEDWEDGE
ncbi:unnamed protein product, partial [Mesorhabditis belari]|uniref:ShKT domain-containing protein n=1 Tax=Mesorhabditis belari TaxID=2138241 RepID=A0AAF3FPP2_9BILA